LLAAQLAGEVVARGFNLAIPGPVLGLVFMLLALAVRPVLAARIEPVAGGLLANLSLLFVPAGVGVMRYGAMLRAHGLAIAAAIVVSTVLSLAVTSLVLTALERRENAA
jgi:holin-like protein